MRPIIALAAAAFIALAFAPTEASARGGFGGGFRGGGFHHGGGFGFRRFGPAIGLGIGLGVLVARDDPLDTYLVTHPDQLLGAPVEATVFDPANPYVVAPHLCAAAQELPLVEQDFALFDGDVAAVVGSLEQAGYLRRRSRGWFWTRRERACELADIRSSGGNPVRIVEDSTGTVHLEGKAVRSCSTPASRLPATTSCSRR